MDDKPKNPGGQPTKFNAKRCADIIDAIYHRIPYEYAAMANGISEKTLYNWFDIAFEHLEAGIDSDYTKFLQDVKKAEMQRIREHNEMIAAKPDRWQADAWILERRWHKHYSSNTQLVNLNYKLDRLIEGEAKNEEK